MKNDPIVEEVRETRRRIYDECEGDLEKLIARLRAAESMDKGRLVTLEEVQRRAAVVTAPA